MAEDDDVDPALGDYFSAAERIEELVANADEEQLAAPVPACPEWTVEDVVRHLIGVADDWVHGRLDDYGSGTWTSRQIERFADSSIDVVVDRWSVLRSSVAELTPDPVMGSVGNWLFGDAVVHEADLRPVLEPGTRPPGPAVERATKAGIARLRGHATEREVPPFVVDALGTRERRIGEADDDAPRVGVDSYDLFRALYGRRSADQAVEWDWSEDPTPLLKAGLPYPFRWAEHPLVDE